MTLPLVAAEVHLRAGISLTDALLELQQRGLKLVFSSRVVRPDLRVRADVQSSDVREALDRVLAPHGLAASEEKGVLVIVRAERPRAERDPASSPRMLPVWSEEIVVQPSRIALLVEEPVAPVTLTRAQIDALPHLGDDVFRTLRLLPGVASADLSAELHLRGGRRDEVLIRLDGQELYDAFHLKEYDNALSIVPASALAKTDLITGAFPVTHGGRMGGVLDMTSAEPLERRMRVVGSIVGVQLEAGDSVRAGRAHWFLSLRRGNTDILGRAFNLEGPAFFDGIGKVETELTPRQSLVLRILASTDRLDFIESDSKELHTEYSSGYAWITHRVLLGSAFVDTAVSRANLERDRRGFESDEERHFDVRDERDLRVDGLTQSWSIQATPAHFVNAGWELRRYDAAYDYVSDRHFETPLAIIRAEPKEGPFDAAPRVIDEQISVYVSDRMRPSESLTIDAGVRFDRQSAVGNSTLSPRLNAAWALSESAILRLGWGRFVQTQRAHELMIADGDVELHAPERSNQIVVGFERLFASPRVSGIRVEVYRRRVSNPRPRYDNLLGPFDPFHEGEFDRVRFEPDRASAEGIELLVHGRPAASTDWFVNYTLSRTEDDLDGAWVPRSIDQRHALNVDVNRRIGAHWNANLAWVYRSGHPTTDVSLETRLDDEGEPEVVPVLGPLNGSRLPSYHRLDLRLSREWQRSSGTFTFFLDGHNVYSRRNVSGIDVKLDEDTGELTAEPEYWPRFFASAGVSWTFNGR